MGNKTFRSLLKQSGQSTVEYLLLLLVVSVLSFSIYNSARFKQFLGPDSAFFTILKSKIEFSYRLGHDSQDDNGDLPNHKLYRTDGGESRFFTTVNQPYGE